MKTSQIPSLSEAFSDHFLLGNIWGGHPGNVSMHKPGAKEHFLYHYNTITASNMHKPSAILQGSNSKNPTDWHWEEADQVVDFATENNLKMVGHTLLWHNQMPGWFTTMQDTNQPLTRAEAFSHLEMYINAIVGRYKKRVWAWDVTNEVLNPADDEEWRNNPDWKQHLRRCEKTGLLHGQPQWYNAFANGAVGDECGSDYVYSAYRLARLADPGAILLYNDYSTEWGTKSEAICQMVVQINDLWRSDSLYDNRPLIEGIGMQFHIFMGFDIGMARESVSRYIDTGVRLHVTEFTVHPVYYDQDGFDWWTPDTVLTPDQVEWQTKMYRDMYKMFMDFSANIDRVSMFSSGGGSGIFGISPEGVVPKPAFWEVIDLANA